NLDAPYVTFYRGTFDNLVMDFSILTTKTDTLKALGLKNLGTASYLKQINNLILWADAGPVGFQGMGVDRKIGNLIYTATTTSWYIENLSEKITDSQKFFISVETYSSLSTGGTIQMQIPILTDNNANGSFDVGDLGIFMDSGNNGPTDANVTNANSQVVSIYSVDAIGPKLVITNLAEGAVINNSHFVIQGMARDQGNTYFKELALYIDDQPINIIDNFDTVNYTWSYDWQNITDGSHTVSIQGRDGNGNNTSNVALNVTVSQQALSLTNSTASSDKTTIKNDGLDKATVTVMLKDTNNLPIISRQITVEAPNMIISLANSNSDSTGKIIFEARSTVIGSNPIIIKVDNLILASLTVNVVTPETMTLGITAGDLIKASTPAIYFYACNGKRYVFPNQDAYLSWYSDFKNVKSITDAQLASIMIGGNVTFKPGARLVKITTDPKVYAVDAGGTLRWISTANLAVSLYGANWATKINDVADSFFTNYKMGTPIETLTDYNLQSVSAAATRIDAGICK
ncbi:MAG: Ig-like domain-containing protein, partial [Candidatus Parcubacteria bacterium]|nr:Ig-like domain-containing protein [Candidatus Parcubacteria bacterium]